MVVVVGVEVVVDAGAAVVVVGRVVVGSGRAVTVEEVGDTDVTSEGEQAPNTTRPMASANSIRIW